jgi:8-hydroxy-5-deazaflavin:NADPH oxidoreductase
MTLEAAHDHVLAGAGSREPIRIGIVGAGSMGRALAVRFAAAGHMVMLSNSRGPDTLVEVIGSIQGNVRAGTVAEAARFGEIVAVAIPVPAIRTLPTEPFAAKIVVDANNYYPEADGHVPALDADETTSSQLLASLLPGATVVKAFNTIYFRRLLEESRPDLPTEERLAIPIAGDDPNAKQTVLELIEQIGFTGSTPERSPRADASSPARRSTSPSRTADAGRQPSPARACTSFSPSRTRAESHDDPYRQADPCGRRHRQRGRPPR